MFYILCTHTYNFTLKINASREHRAIKFSGRIYEEILDFPDSPLVKKLPAGGGDSGSILVREDPTHLRGAKPMCPNC